jgi:hypothetical protein
MWETLDKLGTILGLLAFVGTAYSALKWWQHQRREKVLAHRIPIRLTAMEDGKILYEFPFQPPRRTVTRAEVMGLFGAIPSAEAGKRFEWGWPHRPEFMLHLEEIHRGSRHTLEIPLTAEEFDQIKVPAVRQPTPAAP